MSTKSKKTKAPAVAPTTVLPMTYAEMDPNQIVVGVNYGRGGVLDEAFEAGVRAKVESIEAYGQKEPILCRTLEDGKIGVVNGHERLEACRRLNRPVRVQIDPNITDEAQAKITSVITNQFDKPTALQEAMIVKSFLDDGLTKTEVAALFGKANTNRVAQLEKLLSAGPELQKLVHLGTVSLYAACEVAGDADAEAALIKDVQDGKAVTAVTAAGKKGGKGDGDGEGDSKAGPKRNVKHLNEFIANHEEDGFNADALALLQAVIKFLSGSKTDIGLVNAMKKFS